MYCIEATTPELRSHMTKQQMALELVRMKKNIPVAHIDDRDTVYSSQTEAAECLGIRPSVISRQIQKTRAGKPGSFVEVLDWEPYVDLSVCNCVNEYVLHYIRLYYPDLYESSLHVVDPEAVPEHKRFCEVIGKDLVIDYEDGHFIDLLTNEVIE